MRTLIALAACLAVAAVAGAQGVAKARADANPGHLKMALVNIKCVYSDGPDAAANQRNLQANLDRHLYFIDKAVAEGAEFVGFPEVSLNGYHFSANTTWLSLTGPEVQVLAKKAVEKGIYISAGMAELAPDGKKWNTQFVIGPDGKIIGRRHKIWLTNEKKYVEVGADHNVFPVKGTMMGISTCADGSDYNNVKALADAGAKIIYGPHANTTGGTIAGWYRFRGRWGGKVTDQTVSAPTSNNGPKADMPAGGWIAGLKVHAALHNHAALYNPEYDPPVKTDKGAGWASGAWFIGPDGATLAQMPPSSDKKDCKEYLLVCNIPIGEK